MFLSSVWSTVYNIISASVAVFLYVLKFCLSHSCSFRCYMGIVNMFSSLSRATRIDNNPLHIYKMIKGSYD